MPAALAVDDYLEVVRRAGDALLTHAREAGPATAVPTCPSWTTTHLVAHQAMVHRWATAQVLGEDAAALPSQTALRDRDDLEQYYTDGLGLLIDAVRAAPEDLRAMTFLNDAGSPRTFWARRQAHETAIHGVDARAALLGRTPTTEETGISREFAADGIDELLRGFFTRGSSKLFDGERFPIAIAPTDGARSWRVLVDEQLGVEPGDVPPQGDEAVVLRGSAAALYLALWNRGDSIEITGDRAIVQRWRETQRIRWS